MLCRPLSFAVARGAGGAKSDLYGLQSSHPPRASENTCTFFASGKTCSCAKKTVQPIISPTFLSARGLGLSNEPQDEDAQNQDDLFMRGDQGKSGCVKLHKLPLEYLRASSQDV